MPVIVLLLALLLAGCSNSTTVAGGGGVETTNGIVLLSNGTPASEAAVTLIDRDRWLTQSSHAVVAKLFTRSDGTFSIVHDSIERKLIQIELAGESVIRYKSEDTLKLSPGFTLAGTVKGAASGTIRLAGTTFETDLTDGAFELTNLPAGWYPLILQKETPELLGTVNLTGDIDTTFAVSPLLVDDFSGSFALSPLMELRGGPRWILISDLEKWKFTSGIWELLAVNDPTSATVVTPTVENGVLRLEMRTNKGYGGLSLKLRDANLSALDTVHIRVRGTGTMRLSLETELLNGTFDQYRTHRPLSDQWENLAIPVSDLFIEESENAVLFPWSRVSSEIQRMELAFHNSENRDADTLWYEIDEIRFGGVTLENIE